MLIVQRLTRQIRTRVRSCSTSSPASHPGARLFTQPPNGSLRCRYSPPAAYHERKGRRGATAPISRPHGWVVPYPCSHRRQPHPRHPIGQNQGWTQARHLRCKARVWSGWRGGSRGVRDVPPRPVRQFDPLCEVGCATRCSVPAVRRRVVESDCRRRPRCSDGCCPRPCLSPGLHERGPRF